MITIHKFQLNIVDDQLIQLPAKSIILSAHNQNDTICVWAAVDTAAPLVPRRFLIVGTGQPWSEELNQSGKFVGTVHMAPFVWHVFVMPAREQQP